MNNIDLKIKEFSEKIGIKFKNPALLKQALTHRSYLNENTIDWPHNERLEFLGDAVLELVTTEFLYRKFPKHNEGTLTAYRAALVRTESISNAAREIGVNDYILLSKGESKDSNGKSRTYILANAYEAIVGAIYEDQGYSAAKKFISDTLLHKINSIISNKTWIDPKSYLQEKAQAIESVTPSYKLINESGPDHDKKFTFGVYFGDKLIASGEGRSKQDAQQDAAKNAINKLNW